MSKKLGRILLLVIAGLSLYCLLPHNAYAYIDPGTSSYLLQLLIGTLLVGLYAIKNCWNKIIIFLKTKLFKKNSNKTPSTDCSSVGCDRRISLSENENRIDQRGS